MTRIARILLPAMIGLAACVPPKDKAFYQAASELEQARRAAREVGLPLSMTEQRAPRLPEESNGAGLMVQAFRALQRSPDADIKEVRRLLLAGGEKQLSQAKSILDPYAPALDFAEQALELPGIQWGRDWTTTNPYGIPFPEYIEIKRLTHLFSLRAWARAAEGNGSLAAADLQLAMKVSSAADDDQILIGIAVKASCWQIIARNAAAALSEQPQEAALTRAVLDLSRQPPLSYAEALAYEAAMLAQLTQAKVQVQTEQFAQLRRKEDESPPVRPENVPGEIIRDASLARALQQWTKITQVVQGPGDFRSHNAQLRELDSKIAGEKDATYAFFRASVSDLHRGHAALQRASTAMAMLRGLALAQAFRQKHGRMPKSPAEAGFTEIDPFTGQPFVLNATSEKWELFSPGYYKDSQAAEKPPKPLAYALTLSP